MEPIIRVSYPRNPMHRDYLDRLLSTEAVRLLAPPVPPSSKPVYNTVPHSIEYYPSFMLDRQGWKDQPKHVMCPAEWNVFPIPYYGSPINSVPLPIGASQAALTLISAAEPILQPEEYKLRHTTMTDKHDPFHIYLRQCFNCGDRQHMLRACPFTRDTRVIQANEMLFNAATSNNKRSSKGSQRYYVITNDEKITQPSVGEKRKADEITPSPATEP